ncbi:hypothetical protein EDB81DRAFT_884980 [Dactylonectria macrodidyma]|uniref:Uncharacterized protein n=1 Tax=Dactylonectria macrodidyma TaxID=307937 RepID=A0A9P9IZR4_9HYPO|nr:hypothetical protein EDB81DRAFT_884980 [Dactylonectria macrodidyma]
MCLSDHSNNPFISPSTHRRIPNLFEGSSHRGGATVASAFGILSVQETTHPLAEDPSISPLPPAPTPSILNGQTPTTPPTSSVSRGGHSLHLASLPWPTLSLHHAQCSGLPSAAVFLQWQIIWEDCKSVIHPNHRAKLTFDWFKERLYERASPAGNDKPNLDINIDLDLDIGVICNCPVEVKDYHSECVASASDEVQNSGLIIVSKTVSGMACSTLKGEMVTQLEECVTIYNIEKAIWLGSLVYRDSQDSQSRNSARVFACPSNYHNEFISCTAVRALMFLLF